jgi:hypothetical protein
MRRASICAALVGIAVILPAAPSHANGGIAMGVDVQNSSQTVRDRQGGTCVWEVLSDVIIVNLTDEPITIDSVSFMVSWIASGDRSGVVTDVRVLDNGGLQPGVTLAADGRQTFSPLVLQFGVPCDATFGDLAVRVSSAQGTGSGDAPFLQDGTPVPPGAVGALGLAVLLAAYLALADGRRRRAPIAVALRARSRKVVS